MMAATPSESHPSAPPPQIEQGILGGFLPESGRNRWREIEDGMRVDELEFRGRFDLDLLRPGREEVIKTEIMNPGILQDMIPGKGEIDTGPIEKK